MSNGRSTSYQTGLVATCAALLAVSLVRPRYPLEQYLQHPPTLIALVALFWAARRRWFSNGAMTCLAAMLALHVVGARWIYSYVPYDRWFEAIFGGSPRPWFGWTRNHYDRFVHLAFGALMIWPLTEAAMGFGGLKRRGALGLSLLAVAAMSAAYEVFEWLLAMIAAPDFAEAYNGQQGDMWDAQKDMALALGGSLAASLFALAAARWRRRTRRG
jgi:putative membrane protein